MRLFCLLLAALFSLSAFAKAPSKKKAVCTSETPTRQIPLGSSEVTKATFQLRPEHGALELVEFKSGVKMRLETSGCEDEVSYSFDFKIPGAHALQPNEASSARYLLGFAKYGKSSHINGLYVYGLEQLAAGKVGYTSGQVLCLLGKKVSVVTMNELDADTTDCSSIMILTSTHTANGTEIQLESSTNL